MGVCFFSDDRDDDWFVVVMVMVMMMEVCVTVMIRMVGSQVDNDLVRSVYALERFRAQQYRGGFPI